MASWPCEINVLMQISVKNKKLMLNKGPTIESTQGEMFPCTARRVQPRRRVCLDIYSTRVAGRDTGKRRHSS